MCACLFFHTLRKVVQLLPAAWGAVVGASFSMFGLVVVHSETGIGRGGAGRESARRRWSVLGRRRGVWMAETMRFRASQLWRCARSLSLFDGGGERTREKRSWEVFLFSQGSGDGSGVRNVTGSQRARGSRRGRARARVENSRSWYLGLWGGGIVGREELMAPVLGPHKDAILGRLERKRRQRG